jgi:hypothetical protein
MEGHKPPGIPGKSLFPESWSEQKIMDNVHSIARDWKSVWSKAPYRPSKSGLPRYLAEGVREGTKIRVVIEPQGEGPITAYPIK